MNLKPPIRVARTPVPDTSTPPPSDAGEQLLDAAERSGALLPLEAALKAKGAGLSARDCIKYAQFDKRTRGKTPTELGAMIAGDISLIAAIAAEQAKREATHKNKGEDQDLHEQIQKAQALLADQIESLKDHIAALSQKINDEVAPGVSRSQVDDALDAAIKAVAPELLEAAFAEVALGAEQARAPASSGGRRPAGVISPPPKRAGTDSFADVLTALDARGEQLRDWHLAAAKARAADPWPWDVAADVFYVVVWLLWRLGVSSTPGPSISAAGAYLEVRTTAHKAVKDSLAAATAPFPPHPIATPAWLLDVERHAARTAAALAGAETAVDAYGAWLEAWEERLTAAAPAARKLGSVGSERRFTAAFDSKRMEVTYSIDCHGADLARFWVLFLHEIVRNAESDVTGGIFKFLGARLFADPQSPGASTPASRARRFERRAKVVASLADPSFEFSGRLAQPNPADPDAYAILHDPAADARRMPGPAAWVGVVVLDHILSTADSATVSIIEMGLSRVLVCYARAGGSQASQAASIGLGVIAVQELMSRQLEEVRDTQKNGRFR